MKAHISIGLIVLVAIAVACTGCTTQPAGTQAGGTQSSSAAASSQQAGSTVSSTSVFGTDYTWMQYRTTSMAGGTETTTETKTERSTGNYKGLSAVHLKMTTTTSSGMTSIYDIYYDTEMKNALGGTMAVTVNGNTMTQEIPASQVQSQQAVNFNGDFTMTFAGTEPVTVPAGTFAAANKYTASKNDVAFTYWVSPGIPVPVKYTTSAAQGSSTTELVGWG